MNNEELTSERYRNLMELFESIGLNSKLSFAITASSGKIKYYNTQEYADLVAHHLQNESSEEYAVFDVSSGIKSLDESNITSMKNSCVNIDSMNGVYFDTYKVYIPVEILVSEWVVSGEGIVRDDIGHPLLSMIKKACSQIPVDSNDYIQRINAEAEEERNKSVSDTNVIGRTINLRYIYEKYQIELDILLKSGLIDYNSYNDRLADMSKIIAMGDRKIIRAEKLHSLNETNSSYINLELSDKHDIITVSSDVLRNAFEAYDMDIGRYE